MQLPFLCFFRLPGPFMTHCLHSDIYFDIVFVAVLCIGLCCTQSCRYSAVINTRTTYNVYFVPSDDLFADSVYTLQCSLTVLSTTYSGCRTFPSSHTFSFRCSSLAILLTRISINDDCVIILCNGRRLVLVDISQDEDF